MDKRSLLLLLGIGVSSCATSVDIDRQTEAIAAGLGTPDIGPDQEQRDAVARLRFVPVSGGDTLDDCMGTLVTPRLVITAWHCVGEERPVRRSRPLVQFGQAFPTDLDSNIRTIACQPYPGARNDGVTPTCANWPGPLPAVGPELRQPFDVAVVVLAERVDAENRADGPRVRPMRVAFEDPGSDPSSWVGQSVDLVAQGRENNGDPAQRYRLTQEIVGLRLGTDGFAITHDGSRPADSGGPYVWQPPGQPPRVITVHNNDPRLSGPEVRDWLRPLVEPAPGEGFLAGIYVGPSDVPSVDNPARLPEHDELDPDGDGLFDVHDNCPMVPNVDQRDFDLDGVGDACEGDPDHDGVHEDVDNCPDVRNPSQLDCNADAVAELNRSRADLGLGPVPVRGDACDAVPCADTRLPETSTRVPFGTLVTMDRVEVDARADVPSAFSVLARTAFRFCQCRIGDFVDTDDDGDFDAFVQSRVVGDDEGSRADCQLARNGGCELNALAQIPDPTDPRPLIENPVWRFTTHQRTDGFPDGMAPCPPRLPGEPRPPGCVDAFGSALAPEYNATYSRHVDGDGFAVDRSNNWLLHDEDVPRWIAAGFGDPLRDSIGTGPGLRGAVSGVLWTHTPGAAGTTSADFPFFSTPLVQEQASHYWSGRALAPFEVPQPEPCFVPFLPFIGSDLSCPFCPYSFPLPVLGFRALSGCLPDLRFPGLFLGNVRIDPSEALELPGIELFGGDAGPWLAAAETGPWLPPDGLRYVKLESGSAVQRVVIEQAGGFSESGSCAPGQCGPFPGNFAAVAANPAGTAPVPRQAHAETLSARRGALWVVGGETISDGSTLDEIWVYEVASEQWCLLPPEARPSLGRVHAATYSAAYDALWVLDEVESSPRPRHGRRGLGRRTMRLLRLDPVTGNGAVVGSWRRGAVGRANDEFALAADPDGWLYLVGWRGRAHSHVVLRLRPSEENVELQGWRVGSGRPLKSTVRASDRGLSLYVERGHGRRRVEAVGYAPGDLRSSSGGWGQCF